MSVDYAQKAQEFYKYAFEKKSYKLIKMHNQGFDQEVDYYYLVDWAIKNDFPFIFHFILTQYDHDLFSKPGPNGEPGKYAIECLEKAREMNSTRVFMYLTKNMPFYKLTM